jgi:hypothetical protein
MLGAQRFLGDRQQALEEGLSLRMGACGAIKLGEIVEGGGSAGMLGVRSWRAAAAMSKMSRGLMAAPR